MSTTKVILTGGRHIIQAAISLLSEIGIPNGHKFGQDRADDKVEVEAGRKAMFVQFDRNMWIAIEKKDNYEGDAEFFNLDYTWHLFAEKVPKYQSAATEIKVQNALTGEIQIGDIMICKDFGRKTKGVPTNSKGSLYEKNLVFEVGEIQNTRTKGIARLYPSHGDLSKSSLYVHSNWVERASPNQIYHYMVRRVYAMGVIIGAIFDPNGDDNTETYEIISDIGSAPYGYNGPVVPETMEDLVCFFQGNQIDINHLWIACESGTRYTLEDVVNNMVDNSPICIAGFPVMFDVDKRLVKVGCASMPIDTLSKMKYHGVTIDSFLLDELCKKAVDMGITH